MMGIWTAFIKYRIALACAMIYFLHMGMMRISGLLVVASIGRYNVSREQAAFPYVLRGIVEHLSGPFVGYLGCKLGIGRVTFLGCCLFSIAVAVCFFAESIMVITICWGVFVGISLGMAGHLLPSFICSHFKKNLAKANGISIAGSSLGTFIYSLLYEYLLKTYGTSGSFLILSAFSLNTLGAAMILAYSQQRLEASQRRNYNNNHSLIVKATCLETSAVINDKTCNASVLCEKHLEKVTNELDNSSEMKKDNFENGYSIHNVKDPTFHSFNENNCCVDNDSDEKLDNGVMSCGFKSSSISSQSTSLSNAIENISNTTGEDKIIVSKNSKNYQCNCFAKIKGNNIKSDEFGSNHSKNTSHTPFKQPSREKKTSDQSSSLIWKVYITLLFDPVFVVIVLTQSCFIVTVSFLFTTIIDFALDKAIPMNLAVYLLMSCSISDLFGRLVLGSVPDSGYISDTSFSALCYFVTGISFAGMAISTEFFGILLCLCFSSFVLGGQLLISPIIVSKYFDGERRIIAMTSRYILAAPLSFTISPLIGYFREGLGSYKWLYYSISIFCVLASILLLSLPSIANMRIRRRKSEIIG